jgi:hypothetical protein
MILTLLPNGFEHGLVWQLHTPGSGTSSGRVGPPEYHRKVETTEQVQCSRLTRFGRMHLAQPLVWQEDTLYDINASTERVWAWLSLAVAHTRFGHLIWPGWAT